MQFFQDSATQKVYAFEDNVVVTGATGAFVFTSPSGQTLGPYPTTLVPYTPPVPTAVEIAAVAATKSAQIGYNKAITQGIIVTSAANAAALNATYACDPQTCINMMAEAQFISAFGEFTNLGSTDTWPDINMVPRTFPSTTEFMALTKAQAQYVAACKVVRGQIAAQVTPTPTFPSNAVSIP
jgi:hypothetical protein